jgi:hypothetical protein
MDEMKKLTQEQHDELLKTLKERFVKNPGRHPDINWDDVEARLEKYPDKL